LAVTSSSDSVPSRPEPVTSITCSTLEHCSFTAMTVSRKAGSVTTMLLSASLTR
jgi:hypothetical protein